MGKYPITRGEISVQFNNSDDSFIQAAYEGDLDTVEWELKNKTDPDSKGVF